ncbi:MAG: hypothetical protein ACO3JG_02945 [Luteolibacter sp.]
MFHPNWGWQWGYLRPEQQFSAGSNRKITVHAPKNAVFGCHHPVKNLTRPPKANFFP